MSSIACLVSKVPEDRRSLSNLEVSDLGLSQIGPVELEIRIREQLKAISLKSGD